MNFQGQEEQYLSGLAYLRDRRKYSVLCPMAPGSSPAHPATSHGGHLKTKLHLYEHRAKALRALGPVL